MIGGTGVLGAQQSATDAENPVVAWSQNVIFLKKREEGPVGPPSP